MKQKFTNSRKARRTNLHSYYQEVYYSMSVLERRVRGYYGSDWIEYDAKHPSFKDEVEGVKQIIAKNDPVHQGISLLNVFPLK